jgi:hypothetical protein
LVFPLFLISLLPHLNFLFVLVGVPVLELGAWGLNSSTFGAWSLGLNSSTFGAWGSIHPLLELGAQFNL